MAVDTRWLQQTRQKNQKAVGLAGMGQSADLAATIRAMAAPQLTQGSGAAQKQQNPLVRYALYGVLGLVGITLVVGIARRVRKGR